MQTQLPDVVRELIGDGMIVFDGDDALMGHATVPGCGFHQRVDVIWRRFRS